MISVTKTQPLLHVVALPRYAPDYQVFSGYGVGYATRDINQQKALASATQVRSDTVAPPLFQST